MDQNKVYETIIIGGGQAGLSVAYFLRRNKINYLILDDQKKAGGSWLHTWDSLKLFSPIQFSSLSGWGMPKGNSEYPSKNEFLEYLKKYEVRYDFPIKKQTTVDNVIKEKNLFKIETNQGLFYSKTLVSATGTAKNPFIPRYPNLQTFEGHQIHSSQYKNIDDFEGKRLLIVGGGNSGAQILSEVSKVAQTKWVTLEEPVFLPEDIDGRYLFNEATRKFLGKNSKNSNQRNEFSLNNIVVVESVKEAQNRGVLHAQRPFKSFYEKGVVWQDNTKENFDSIIWCTGFKPHLKHLQSLNLIKNDRIETKHTRSKLEPKLWLVGYGSWTGFASATIYGVGKTARQSAKEIFEELKE